MIGNDVVDLRDPETQPGATHPRFDARVFGRAERRAIRRSAVPNRLRWALWAGKESGYKIARKRDPRAAFSPVRFRVYLDGALHGRVEWDGGRAALRVEEQDGGLHAVAWSSEREPARLAWGLCRLTAAGGPPAGDAVRRLAVGSVAPLLGAEPCEMAVAREGRVPRLRLRGAAAPADLSLSHHGGLVAFACALPPAAALR